MGRLDEESILQDEKCCWLCKNTNVNMLERHEAFFGNPNRKNSIQDKLTVLLCADSCHRTGSMAVHMNRETDLKLKEFAQAKAMEFYNWTTEDFIKRYGRNYL